MLELAPKTRSTDVAVHFRSPVARSWPSKMFSSVMDGFHSVPMSSRLAKKSLLNRIHEHLIRAVSFNRRVPEALVGTALSPTYSVVRCSNPLSYERRVDG